MGRTAMAWGSIAAHKLATHSQSELGFASNFNMYAEVQLRAKRIPGPHARSSELRDGAMENPDQCGDACVLCLEQKVALLKWHSSEPW